MDGSAGKGRHKEKRDSVDQLCGLEEIGLQERTIFSAEDTAEIHAGCAEVV